MNWNSAAVFVGILALLLAAFWLAVGIVVAVSLWRALGLEAEADRREWERRQALRRAMSGETELDR